MSIIIFFISAIIIFYLAVFAFGITFEILSSLLGGCKEVYREIKQIIANIGG